MFIFSFIYLPLLLVWFCFYYKSQKLVPVISIGIIVAILVCACQAFFTFAHRVIPYNFSDNFLYLLFRQTLLPLVILYTVFCLVSRDEIQFKVDCFLPLTLSYYAIYLPYIIITTSEGLYSWFVLFFKPMLFGAMLVQTSISINYFYKFIKNKKLVMAILVTLLSICYMSIPAIFEAMYLIKLHVSLVVIFGIIYSLIPVALIFLKKINVIKL
ncbi:MAG: hypothetical protein K5829_10260 [Treponema sp.]|nr:hypothetical protein [Treponema sp.]